jgi:hypothetical protein
MSGKKKKRGRPKGVKNGEGKSLVPIKEWTIKHDLVVNLHIGMHSNEEIAQLTDLSAVRVSQILRDPQAKILIKEAQKKFRERLGERIEDGLISLAEKALENLRETIELDGLPHGSDFKKHQDKMSLEVLKGRGFLSKESDQGASTSDPLPAKLAERLAVAFEKTAEAEGYLARANAETEDEEDQSVEEADYELVES